jgi:predicted heme/steroid binding protein
MKPKIITLLIFSLAIFLTACVKSQEKFPMESTILPQPTQAETPKPETQISPRTFTLEELAQYNGKNGKPAYLAVDGLVYDLTSVFKNGTHYQHLAGRSLTKEFYSAHAKSALQKYPIVGKLKE